jgi:hypothetical protein
MQHVRDELRSAVDAGALPADTAAICMATMDLAATLQKIDGLDLSPADAYAVGVAYDGLRDAIKAMRRR